MPIQAWVPVIPSADLEKSLRLWVDGLAFFVKTKMRDGDGQTEFSLTDDEGFSHCFGVPTAGTGFRRQIQAANLNDLNIIAATVLESTDRSETN